MPTLKRVLLVWEQGGHIGHLGKLLPVAQALQDAGHEVVWGVAEHHQRRVSSLLPGIEPIPIPCMGLARIAAPICHAELLLGSGFSSAKQAQLGVQAWHKLFDAIEPDAVLVDASPMALYAARCKGLHSIVMGHGFDIPPHGVAPCFAPWTDGASMRLADSSAALQGVLDELGQTVARKEHTRAPMGIHALFDPAHTALCTWPELDYFDRPESATHGSSIYAGPIWGDLPGAQPCKWPNSIAGAARAKVLCYLYLGDNRFDLLLQSFVQADASVMVIAPGISDMLRGPLEALGVTVINHAVQISGVLEQCNAVVCHGGMGLVGMAMQAGKPLLLLPEYMEHVVLAYRLNRQGLALATVRLQDRNVLHGQISRLLEDDGLSRRVQAISTKYAGYRPRGTARAIAQRLVARLQAPPE